MVHTENNYIPLNDFTFPLMRNSITNLIIEILICFYLIAVK